MKKQKGITLIALIITIVVLLILAGVAIGTLDETDIIGRAKDAVSAYNTAQNDEKKQMDSVDKFFVEYTNPWTSERGLTGAKIDVPYKGLVELRNYTFEVLSSGGIRISTDEGESVVSNDEINELIKNGEMKITSNNIVEVGNLQYKFINNGEELQLITDNQIVATLSVNFDESAPIILSNSTSYVGCYADVDGDGTIDGKIYADLAIGGTGEFMSSDGSYVIQTEENLKEYGITKIDGENVVVAKENTTGNDRFYVMDLDIVKAEEDDRVWFILLNLPKEGEEFIETQTEFGTGKNNTGIMKNSEFAPEGEGQYLLWKTIESDLDNGWFIPSRGELAVFADKIGFDIPFGYWTSSVNQDGTGWLVSSGGIGSDDTNKQGLIILSITF